MRTTIQRERGQANRRRRGLGTTGARRWLVAALVAATLATLHGCASAPPPTATDLGWQALEQGDWRTAKTRFGEALRENARDGRAWHGLARAQLSGRDPESALRSLTSLSQVDVARFSGEARATYADALHAAVGARLDRKQTQAALQAARALAQLDPRRSGVSRLLGRSLVAEGDRLRLRGDRNAALPLFQEACRVTPGDLEAWVGAVEILLERKQGGQAIRMLESARKAHPTAGVIRSLTLQAMRFR